MKFEGFLIEYLTSEDLKQILRSLGLPVTASNKQELVSRIISHKRYSKIDILFYKPVS
jgi:Ca2+-binding EF-hand superfamily protein